MRKYKKMSLRAFRKALSETDATRYLVSTDSYRSLLVFVINEVARREKDANEKGLFHAAEMFSKSWDHLFEIAERYEVEWKEVQ